MTRHMALDRAGVVGALPLRRLGPAQSRAGLRQARSGPDQRRADEQERRRHRREDRPGRQQPRVPSEELADPVQPAQFRGILQRAVVQEAAEVLGQVVALLISARRVGIQALADDALQAPGDVPPDPPQRGGVLAPLDGHGLDLGGEGRIAPALLEEAFAGEHLGQDQARASRGRIAGRRPGSARRSGAAGRRGARGRRRPPSRRGWRPCCRRSSPGPR